MSGRSAREARAFRRGRVLGRREAGLLCDYTPEEHAMAGHLVDAIIHAIDEDSADRTIEITDPADLAVLASIGRSEAAGDEVIVVNREEDSAAASSPASPSVRSAGVPASRSTRGAAGPANEPGARQRDTRLGRFHDVRSFVLEVERVIGMPPVDVREIAGIGRRGLNSRLPEYEGGLDALYAECARQAEANGVNA